MTSTACFMIVSRNDIPIYEAEVGAAPKVCCYLSDFLGCLCSLVIPKVAVKVKYIGP